MDLQTIARADPPVLARSVRPVMSLYKGLGRFGQSIFGGHVYWNLPLAGKPGEWMPPIGHVWPGASGYHLAHAEDLLRYWLAPRLFVAEGRGACVVAPAGSAVVFQEARLVRELRWDLDAALRFYGDCLEHAIAEARRHGDFVDEARHCRRLGDAHSGQSDDCWHDTVRLGLCDLATALGGIWHRAERRRRVPDPLPSRTHIERAQEWQLRRFLACLGEDVPNEKELMTYA